MKPITLTRDQFPHPPAVYSQAVRAGDFVFVAGQGGFTFPSGALAEDFETQARQAFENLSTVLKASGTSLRQVVKTTIWLCDAENFDVMNKLYAEFFPHNAPVRSTPIVNLPKPGMKISIEAIAAAGDS